MITSIFGTVLTDNAPSSNNRGESNGNQSTLQKMLFEGRLHSCYNSAPVRRSFRQRMMTAGVSTNVKYDNEKLTQTFTDPNLEKGVAAYADIDLLGYMNPKAKKSEENEFNTNDDAETTDPVVEDKSAKKGKKAPKGKGSCDKRRGPFSMNMPVSLRPWNMEVSFNCRQPIDDGDPVPYTVERHTTEYQYPFGIEIESVKNKEHLSDIIDAIRDPARVAGGHSSFLYSFKPVNIVLRLTNDFSSGFSYVFRLNDKGEVCLPSLIYSVQSGEIPAKELIIAGPISESADAKLLVSLGAKVFAGVKMAIEYVKNTIASENGGEYAVLATQE